MPKPTIECHNCNQRFESHYPYCPYCGLQAEDKLTLGILFNNTISNYFSVDARFFKSFIPLMIKPGYLAKRFVQGKRLLYLHPAQMYLFVSVVFFFLFSFVSRQQAQDIDTAIKEDILRSEHYADSLKQHEEDSIALQQYLKPIAENKDQLGLKDEELKALDSLLTNKKFEKENISFKGFNEMAIDSMVKAGATDEEIYDYMGMKKEDGVVKRRMYKQVLKFMKSKSGGSVVQAFYDSVPIAMFFLLPIFALILKIFYYKKGRFAHHLVFSFYFFAFLFMVFGLLVLTSLIWKDFPGWVIVLTMLSTFFYLFLGVKRFYEQGYFLSFIKSGMVSFVFLSIVIPFATVIMGIIAFFSY